MRFLKRVPAAWTLEPILSKAPRLISRMLAKREVDKATFLVSDDDSEDKFSVLAFCHNCNAWASAAIEGTGGKGVSSIEFLNA
jgi:hypothetical protein